MYRDDINSKREYVVVKIENRLGMYKSNLIVGVLIQVLFSVWFLMLAIVSATVALKVVTLDGIGIIETIDPIVNTMSIAIGILTTIKIISATVSILALSNFNKAKRGEREFNSGLAVVAGVLNLFDIFTLIPGILILANISRVRDGIDYNNGSRRNDGRGDRREYREDDGYRDERRPRDREYRDPYFRRNDGRGDRREYREYDGYRDERIPRYREGRDPYSRR